MPTANFYDGSALVKHWIGGRAIALAGTPTQDVFNPATGEVSRQVLLGGTAEVEAAVESANIAFAGWANTPPIRRARILNRFLGLLNQHRDDLARSSRTSTLTD